MIDSELRFDEHILLICTKVRRKINALVPLLTFMSYGKCRLTMKAFIDSQFNYCPLIWIFHSRTLSSKINRLHERTSRIAPSDFKSSFNELLQKDNSFRIHHRNIQSLSIEIHKFLNVFSPNIKIPCIKQPILAPNVLMCGQLNHMLQESEVTFEEPNLHKIG